MDCTEFINKEVYFTRSSGLIQQGLIKKVIHSTSGGPWKIDVEFIDDGQICGKVIEASEVRIEADGRSPVTPVDGLGTADVSPAAVEVTPDANLKSNGSKQSSKRSLRDALESLAASQKKNHGYLNCKGCQEKEEKKG